MKSSQFCIFEPFSPLMEQNSLNNSLLCSTHPTHKLRAFSMMSLSSKIIFSFESTQAAIFKIFAWKLLQSNDSIISSPIGPCKSSCSSLNLEPSIISKEVSWAALLASSSLRLDFLTRLATAYTYYSLLVEKAAIIKTLSSFSKKAMCFILKAWLKAFSASPSTWMISFSMNTLRMYQNPLCSKNITVQSDFNL